MDQNDNYVYIKVNYAGFIPVLNAHGPVRSMWAAKETVKDLIRAGYDIDFINRTACPEFCKQMDAYRKSCEEKDYVGAKNILDTVFKDNPNSVVNQAIKASENAIVTESSTDVVKEALKASGIDANGGDIPVDPVEESEYSDQLNALGGEGEAMGEYSESGNSNIIDTSDDLDFIPDSAPVFDGEIEVTRENTGKNKNKKK